LSIIQDKFLLNELKTGNADAYELLFKKYYKLLSIQAFYIIEDEMEAEDMVQSLFLEIWEKKLYHNINSSLKSYLQMTVKNRCLKILAQRKTLSTRIDNYTYSLAHSEEHDPEELQSTEHKIINTLQELPRQRQQAFTLVYLKDKKYKETADEMGISINSVKSHLKLAITELRKKLKDFK
jgi:RNA polymerase sigma factor (sigma-70 family)